MPPIVLLLILIPFAYLSGSLPFGLWVGLAKGVDPRKAGSGNIGATNVGRLLGGRFFAVVFCLDLLKGLLPMLTAGAILRHQHPSWQNYVLWLLVGTAAIVGHLMSVFLNFKGGKGVATSAGVVLGLFPYFTFAGVAALLVFLAVFLITRYVSAASMLAAIAFPIAYLLIGMAVSPRWPVFSQQLPLLLFSLLIPALIIYRHRGNLARLRAGTEHKIGGA